MSYRDLRECIDSERGTEDVGLAAGRSQREKKRSYKDLLREEEEIAEQVRKSSKKRSKELDLFLGSELHKKKKKHSSEDYHADLSSSDLAKKKKKTSLPSPPAPSSSDTAMDLLKAITSPQVGTSTTHPSKKPEKILATPINFSSPSQPPHKDHHKKSGEVSGDDSSHRSKKSKPLTLREPDGLRMKLILSPNEKSEEDVVSPQGGPGHSDAASSKKNSKKLGREEMESRSSHKKHKKESYTPRSGGTPDSASSTGGEMEAGDLVIDDSLRDMKKKKKSKKSKKKKDKHKDEKHKKHSKSKREHEVEQSPTQIASPGLPSPPPPPPTASTPPTSPPSIPLQPQALVIQTEEQSDKKKKKEDPEKPKKKNMSAYQVFSKEYRVSIIAEHPGIDFGELSKKLAEVWKQLPEKDKLVWKQKAQYLQHKQNKAEATTVKRKSSSSESAPRSKGSSSGLVSPNKKSPTSVASFSASPAKVPDTEPIDVAAHLQLLGESLSLIGHRLQETEGMVAVSGSLSVLLDSILCALGPLVCLTSHVPQLNACPKQILSNTLDNIAYVMPGL